MQPLTFPELRDNMMAHYNAREYADALDLLLQNADRFPEQAVHTTFWKMCLFSLCGRPAEVLSVFQQGLEAGFWWQRGQFGDPDLDAVRDLPEFKRLVEVSHDKYEAARKHIQRDQTILVPEPPASGKYPLLIALHGRNGNKDAHLEPWQEAQQRGWLVLLPQSTQPLFPGAYCWDDPAVGFADLLADYQEASLKYQIDLQRVIVAGFSQGSGMALYAALRGSLPARGFIGIGTWWRDAGELDREKKDLRAYFVTGEKDPTLERVREIQAALRRNNIPFGEEVHPDVGHAFPADFGPSLEKAIKFILE